MFAGNGFRDAGLEADCFTLDSASEFVAVNHVLIGICNWVEIVRERLSGPPFRIPGAYSYLMARVVCAVISRPYRS